MVELELVYCDDYLVAINKPHGLLVHRSKLAAEATEYALQILRNQLGRRVTPIHRIDRKTSGVLLFSLDETVNRAMNILFDEGKVNKTYHAIVRGYTPLTGTVNYPLRKENGQMQEAVTNFRTLEQVEIDVPLGKHQTQRYSLVEVTPETGRMHQIRRHFDHLRHPIIGDRPHGCNKQNRFFKEHWEIITMMLHATEVSFVHPISGERVVVKAGLQPEFKRCLDVLGFSKL